MAEAGMGALASTATARQILVHPLHSATRTTLPHPGEQFVVRAQRITRTLRVPEVVDDSAELELSASHASPRHPSDELAVLAAPAHESLVESVHAGSVREPEAHVAAA